MNEIMGPGMQEMVVVVVVHNRGVKNGDRWAVYIDQNFRHVIVGKLYNVSLQNLSIKINLFFSSLFQPILLSNNDQCISRFLCTFESFVFFTLRVLLN